MMNNLILEADSLDPYIRTLEERLVPYFVFEIAQDRPGFGVLVVQNRWWIIYILIDKHIGFCVVLFFCWGGMTCHPVVLGLFFATSPNRRAQWKKIDHL